MSGFLVRRWRRLLPWIAVGVFLVRMLGGPVMAAQTTAAPQPDPAAIATGDKSSAFDAGGNAFVVSEPTDKADPDYAAKKEAFDEYQAQATKEPLAVKLADSVGHVRLATNAAWTLNTGYLVLFMQAGFALLTCGLVRRKNAAHLMMLNHGNLLLFGKPVNRLHVRITDLPERSRDGILNLRWHCKRVHTCPTAWSLGT
jgi:hypothetical protein